jgi:hypothetical protein
MCLKFQEEEEEEDFNLEWPLFTPKWEVYSKRKKNKYRNYYGSKFALN